MSANPSKSFSVCGQPQTDSNCRTSELLTGAEHTCTTSISPLIRTLTSEQLNDNQKHPLSQICPQLESDKLFGSPSETLEWDMIITPPSPKCPVGHEAQQIPVFRQNRGGGNAFAVPGFRRKTGVLINNRQLNQYHQICSSETTLFESLGSAYWPTSFGTRVKTDASQGFGDEACSLKEPRDTDATPLTLFDAQLASPTFTDVTSGAEARKAWRRSHSRQTSSSLSGPQLTTLGPLCFMSPCSPRLLTDRSGPLQYSMGDYFTNSCHTCHTATSFGSPTHASVTCSALCMGGCLQHRSDAMPPALTKEYELVPPYKHWDDIGYLSLSDRHGDYHQRLEALMSPTGTMGHIDFGPLTSNSEPALPFLYHAVNNNPMFVLSGAECLLAPKEAPLVPLQSSVSVTEGVANCSSQTSSAAALSRTQPATITLELPSNNSSPMTSCQSQAGGMTTKVPVYYVGNHDVDSVGGYTTDVSSQRSGSTPSSTGGATIHSDSYLAFTSSN